MSDSFYPYKNTLPTVAPDAFIAPGAKLIGDVVIGPETGIWFNCVVRGDVAEVRIGARTNVQDGSVIHVTRGGHPTIIGDEVTIGHMTMIHAARLESRCFVGMGALVMDDTIIESGGMLAAGAMLTPGKRLPAGELWAGRPAKKMRDLTQAEADFIPVSAENYRKHVHEYLAECSS